MTFDLNLVVKELNQMVADGIVDNYAIGGAVAANVYLEAATTEDVDVFVIFKTTPSSSFIDPSPVLNYFKEKGYKMRDDRMMIGGWPVQFLPPPGGLEEEALRNAVILEDPKKGIRTRVFTAEHLAAIALKTGRAKDRSRLLQFREEGALDNKVFEEIVSRHGLKEKWIDFQNLFPPETK